MIFTILRIGEKKAKRNMLQSLHAVCTASDIYSLALYRKFVGPWSHPLSAPESQDVVLFPALSGKPYEVPDT